MTIQQLRLMIAAQLNLPAAFDGTPASYRDVLSDQQKIDLTNAMGKYIAEHPTDFNATQVDIGNNLASNPIPPPVENSPVSDFVNAFEDEALKAGASVAGVGQGVLTTLSAAKYLIPIAAVVVLAIVGYGFYLKQTKQ